MRHFDLNKIKPINSPRGKRVYCETHGEVPGYIVCSCVLKFFAEVRRVVPPSNAGAGMLGEITCIRSASDHQLSDWLLVCVHCARNAGIDKVGGRIAPKD